MKDLVQYVLSSFTEKELSETSIDTLVKKGNEAKEESVFRAFSKGRKDFLSFSVQLMDPAVFVKKDTNLYEAAKTMAAQRAHRALVVNEENLPVSLITQSRILKLISVSSKHFTFLLIRSRLFSFSL